MKKYLEDDDGGLLTDPLFQRLFQNSVTSTEPSNLPNGRVLNYLTPAQAHFLINELYRLIKPRKPTAIIQLPPHPEKITFRELVEICDLVFPDRKILEPVVDRIFDRYVSQIGFVMCRRIPSKVTCIGKKSNSKKWKSFWCTLIPGTIFLWPLHKPPTVANRQTISLDSNTVVHMGTFEEDRFTWQLFTSKGKFQFGHFDEIQRQHWISDMSLVIEFRTKADLLDYDRAYSTKSEHLGNHDKDISWKLALESENHRLTELLNEERKALYDEEIVRQLATRMLDEERERNEKMEKILQDCQDQLEMEREIRMHLEQRLSEQVLTNTSLLEAAASGDSTTKLTPDQLDYLIISTQSI